MEPLPPELDPELPQLTKKQVRFCQEFAKCFSGAAAARAAKVPGKSAARVAYRWLNDPKFRHVQEFLEELIADDAEQRNYDWQLLRQSMRSRLTVTTSDYFKDGVPINPDSLEPEVAQHIQSFTYAPFKTLDKKGRVVQEGFTKTVALTSLTKTQEMLGRHSGFFSRETNGDQFNDYLQAESQLPASLSLVPDEDEDEDDAGDAGEDSDEAASGEDSD